MLRSKMGTFVENFLTFTHTMLRMESFSLMAWRHFLHRATDEWTYKLESEWQRSRKAHQIIS